MPEIATITEKQLCTLEDKVRRGSAAFVEVGTALAKIREGKGYKLRGFDTFEAYCEKEFGITDRHGRRLIQSAETSASVKKLTGAAPANESVAREWAPLVAEPEKIKKVTEQLEKKGYSVVTATAEAVKEAVQRLAPKPANVTPGSGKAVVIPGNGHSAKPAPVVEADPGPGACPYCGERPDRYFQSDETWQCGDCNGIVMLSVVKWPPEATTMKVCPNCKHESKGTHPFCNSCGSKLK
jgi:hypothetical protein